MKRLVIAAAAASLVAEPAPASDFGKLADPAFARSLLISPKRGQEAMCAALARHEAKTGKGIGAVGAKAMGDLVHSRLVTEIGAEGPASDMIESWLGWFEPRPDDKPENVALKAEVAVDLAKRCEPLFETYRKGGVAAVDKILQPAPGLIPLQPMSRCLAIAEYLADKDPNPLFKKQELGEISELAHHGLGAAEKAQFEAEVASESASLKQNQPELDLIQRRGLACLATFRQRAQEAYPERF